jgi:hypothetical protein
MSNKVKDPLYIVGAIKDMILDIVDTVIASVDEYIFENGIDSLEEELQEFKTEQIEIYAEQFNKRDLAAAAETWKKYREGERHRQSAIDTMTRQRDQLNLSSLYVQMGITNVYNGILMAYGVVAPTTPVFKLKGSGDIILQSAAQKNLYATAHMVGGGPTSVIHETVDTVSLLVTTAMEIGDLLEQGVKQGQESKRLAAKIPERNKKNTAVETKENTEREKSDQARAKSYSDLKALLTG